MNSIINDLGQTVHSVGADGSLARVRVQYPKLIERLNSLYNGEARVDVAIDTIREAGIRSEMETNNLLAASHYGDSPCPITSMVYSVARSNLRLFCDTYRAMLARAYSEHPTDYAWPKDQLQTVADKMCKAVERGSFNKDSRAFRDTCKELGIKHTYSAIAEFVNHSETPKSC